MVRLLALVCAIVGVDTVFFSALTPLLPHYAAAAGLSKAGAGDPDRGLPGRDADRVAAERRARRAVR